MLEEKLESFSGVENFFGSADDKYLACLRSTNSSNQIEKNVRLVIRLLNCCFARNSRTTPAEVSLLDIETVIDLFSEYQRSRKIKKTTYGPQISIIKGFWRFYTSLNQNFDLPSSFPSRLMHFLKLGNLNLKRFFSEEFEKGFSYKQLFRWSQELPWVKNKKEITTAEFYLEAVEKIERLLALEPGLLTATLPRGALKKEIPKQTQYVVRVRALPLRRYGLSTPETDREIADFIEYKTSIKPPKGLDRQKGARFTGTNGAANPTADLVRAKFINMLGFFNLPSDEPDPRMRGMGIPKDKLSLGLLTDKDCVEKFLTEFMRVRSGGIYHKGHLLVLNIVTSMLRKKFGYLYQCPEFAEKLGLDSTAVEWRRRCLKTRDRLLDLKAEIEEERNMGGENYGMARDTNEPIQNILRDSNPLLITLKAIGSMADDLNKFESGSLAQAIFFRDLLLMTMIQSNPLRSRMFRIMELDRHLHKRNDGRWWLSFKRTEFKNRNSLKEDYEMPLNKEIGQMIEIYLEKHRVRLRGAAHCNFVFLSDMKRITLNSPVYHFIEGDVYNIVKKRTFTYFPGEYGFGPHSFRHILATGIIKFERANGFYLASRMLHDTLETVRRTYAHLRTSEEIEPYNIIFSDLSRMIGFGRDFTFPENLRGGKDNENQI